MLKLQPWLLKDLYKEIAFLFSISILLAIVSWQFFSDSTEWQVHKTLGDTIWEIVVLFLGFTSLIMLLISFGIRLSKVYFKKIKADIELK